MSVVRPKLFQPRSLASAGVHAAPAPVRAGSLRERTASISRLNAVLALWANAEDINRLKGQPSYDGQTSRYHELGQLLLDRKIVHPLVTRKGMLADCEARIRAAGEEIGELITQFDASVAKATFSNSRGLMVDRQHIANQIRGILMAEFRGSPVANRGLLHQLEADAQSFELDVKMRPTLTFAEAQREKIEMDRYLDWTRKQGPELEARKSVRRLLKAEIERKVQVLGHHIDPAVFARFENANRSFGHFTVAASILRRSIDEKGATLSMGFSDKVAAFAAGALQSVHATTVDSSTVVVGATVAGISWAIRNRFAPVVASTGNALSKTMRSPK